MKNIIKKAIGVLLILLTMFYTLIGCVNSDDSTTDLENEHKNGLEFGFIGTGGLSRIEIAAYKCDKNTFNIDDVTITFYYGFVFSQPDDKALEIASYPDGFDICFVDEKGNIMLYRHSDENFISERYKIKTTYNENDNSLKYEFNHSEKITIPKEMFINESGMVRFVIKGINVKGQQLKNEPFVGLVIFYIKKDNQVVLYDNGDYWKEDVENEK